MKTAKAPAGGQRLLHATPR